jgi:ornithine cyclodeaminase/alanine dehydrogenase-like protein (mu-crystallin family)
VIVVFDAENGVPLAILDSIDVTIKRTAAALAVAAKYLARTDSSVAMICGCGQQARAQLRALHLRFPLTKVASAFDLDERAANRSQRTNFHPNLRYDIDLFAIPQSQCRRVDVCITCTTANEIFLYTNKTSGPLTFIRGGGRR